MLSVHTLHGIQVQPDSEHPLVHQYLRYRAQKYQELGFLTAEELSVDGLDFDEDDPRSMHIVVCEHLAELTSVCGCLRLIVRGHDQILPVERLFPDAFDSPLPANSIECSRFIASHASVGVQLEIINLLFRTGFEVARKENLHPYYGIVEIWLARYLRRMHFIVQELAPSKFITEYNSLNTPVQITVEDYIHQSRLEP